jgi:hypothetical protein
LSGIDPVSGELVALFDPRNQQWDDHFVMRGPLVEGRTRVGRATIHVLAMNTGRRLQLRSQLLSRGKLL